jgi:hypothetical protein
MADNIEILNAAVSLLVRAALLAARFSGRMRQRSLKRLAAKDADAKAKEILFLKDRVYQLEMQISILQKHLHKKDKKPRYEVRERLLILWHIEAFQIPRRKVSCCCAFLFIGPRPPGTPTIDHTSANPPARSRPP